MERLGIESLQSQRSCATKVDELFLLGTIEQLGITSCVLIDAVLLLPVAHRVAVMPLLHLALKSSEMEIGCARYSSCSTFDCCIISTDACVIAIISLPRLKAAIKSQLHLRPAHHQFCGAHNFRNRYTCFKCRAPRQDTGGLPPNFQVGDWLCPMCNAHNYKDKTACFKCGAHKPQGRFLFSSVVFSYPSAQPLIFRTGMGGMGMGGMGMSGMGMGGGQQMGQSTPCMPKPDMRTHHALPAPPAIGHLIALRMSPRP